MATSQADPVLARLFFTGEIIYTNIFCKHKIINSIPCLLTQLIAWQKNDQKFYTSRSKIILHMPSMQ